MPEIINIEESLAARIFREAYEQANAPPPLPQIINGEESSTARMFREAYEQANAIPLPQIINGESEVARIFREAFYPSPEIINGGPSPFDSNDSGYSHSGPYYSGSGSNSSYDW